MNRFEQFIQLKVKNNLYCYLRKMNTYVNFIKKVKI